MGRSARARAARAGSAGGPSLAAAWCHFVGSRDYCQGTATVHRGAVPLCSECDARASSLTRLPRVPEGRPAVAAPVAPAQPATCLPPDRNPQPARPTANPDWHLRTPTRELELIALRRQKLAHTEALAVKVARAAGMSWQVIADALDLPLATVHRRHRPAS